jgi:hypothetical protein
MTAMFQRGFAAEQRERRLVRRTCRLVIAFDPKGVEGSPTLALEDARQRAIAAICALEPLLAGIEFRIEDE